MLFDESESWRTIKKPLWDVGLFVEINWFYEDRCAFGGNLPDGQEIAVRLQEEEIEIIFYNISIEKWEEVKRELKKDFIFIEVMEGGVLGICCNYQHLKKLSVAMPIYS